MHPSRHVFSSVCVSRSASREAVKARATPPKQRADDARRVPEGAGGVCGGDALWWHVLFLYGHGQISTLLWESILRECGEQHLKFGTGESPAGCSAALARVGGAASCDLSEPSASRNRLSEPPRRRGGRLLCLYYLRYSNLSRREPLQRTHAKP